jgi:hypothetical protein
MSPELDTTAWSGEGAFTQQLVDWFTTQMGIAFLKIEDAPSTRADVEYNFISNEIFLRFRTHERIEQDRRWGFVPVSRTVPDKLMTLEELEPLLTEAEEIGPPDYIDDGMIQYLHTERVIPPYQTKGYKLIELVRIYEEGTPSRA